MHFNRYRYLRVLVIFLAGTLSAVAQTAAISGKIANVSSSGVGSNAYLQAELAGCGNNRPQYNGGVIVAPFQFPTDANGNFSGTIVRNDKITCGGDVGNATYYWMQPFIDGQPVDMRLKYRVTSAAFDWNLATPISVSPVVPAPTGDSTYARLDTGNQPFTGNLRATSLENIKFAENFLGSDIGNSINLAFASFGTAPACGAVYVPLGVYSFTTKINVLNRDGCALIGPVSWASKLVYTGTTGPALLFDNTTGTGLGRLYLSGITIDGTGSTNATGIESIRGYYQTWNDVEVSNFQTDCEINGGGSFGANVFTLTNVRCVNASSKALWFTGPNVAGEGAYNVVMNGGQAGCSTTTASDGLILDTQSTDNQFNAVLVNGCTRGLHDASLGSNTFTNISAQGNTTGIQIDASAHSDFIETAYCFSNGTPITNNGIDTNIINHCDLTKNNEMHNPLSVSTYNGGAPEPSIILGASAINPRVDYYRSTGAGTFYPFRTFINAAGNFEVDRCDTTVTKGSEANCQPVMTITPLGLFTFSDNTGTSHASLTGAGVFTGTGFTDGFNNFQGAQINRPGAQVEVQFAGGAGSKFGIGAGGSNPIIGDANTGQWKAQNYATNGNCSGVGTAASPSVASCGSASAGSFSCDPAATGATCKVNTTAVTANSQIFVWEDETLGTRLGVTCNTGTNVLPVSRLLAARVPSTSFTINLGTVTTNPGCFGYTILN